MSEDFYRNLKAIENFAGIIDPNHYSPVPEDWYVVITDVVNSTQAIEEGRYKDVNTAGGLAAMALSNLYKNMEHPYVFGGDGVTFLIPGTKVDDVRSIMVDTKRKVGQFFDLTLRVGMVPVSDLLQLGTSISVSKWKVSEFYYQAIFKGSGVDKAEELVKAIDSPYLLMIDEPTPVEANFEGFTCRWKDIPSDKGETVSIIIKENPNANANFNLFASFQKLESILGGIEEYHPINNKTLQMAGSPKTLLREATVSAGSRKGIIRLFHLIKIYLQSLVVKFAMVTGLPLKGSFYTLRDLKQYNIQSSDFRKFDGSLKMVVSISPKKRALLEDFLNQLEAKGSILYGIHISNRALLTCLMHSGSASEVHFVDGADGGYAMAAKMIKEKLTIA
ncbi:MAG: DUF3095 domain-containing protein [Leptospira sp.]|nr:DUF3095 domain-containing protein [Leptospira sp.]